LVTALGDPQRSATSARELRNLNQSNFPTIVDYENRFRILAADVTWPQDLLIDFFRDGLRPDVKTMLIATEAAGTSFARIDDIISVASRLDSQLSPLRTRRNQTENPPAQIFDRSSPRQPLSDSEKARR
jgi:hypothetical protein